MRIFNLKIKYILYAPIAAVIIVAMLLISLSMYIKTDGEGYSADDYNQPLATASLQPLLLPINENMLFYQESLDLPLQSLAVANNIALSNQRVDVIVIKKLFDTPTNSVGSVEIDGFPYFCQADYPDVPYGDKTIASYGCGPTNMAMVINALTDYTTNPIIMARLAEQKGCFVSGSGTAYAFFDIAAKQYGVKLDTQYAAKNQIIADLRAGKLIIINVGPSEFTSRAHFLLLRGVAEDGSIIIADSWSRELSQRTWSLDYLLSILKMGTVWVFSA